MNENALTRDDELIGIETESARSEHPLDAPDVQQRFRRVRAWRDTAADLQRDNRLMQMQDHDFYDGVQWSHEDMLALKERGQAPLVFNQIKPTVDWIIGTERRTRVDYRVLPREPQDADGAEIKTNLLKYVSDINRMEYARSRAFADAVKAGVGWLEIGVRSDQTDDPVFVGYEDWRNVWYDPLSVEHDLSDARFVFREKYVDLDVALSMFPDRADCVQASAIDGGQFSLTGNGLLDDVDAERDIYDASAGAFTSGRSRVRLVECWYRMPEKTKVLRGEGLGTLNGSLFDPEAHASLVQDGHASTYDAIRMQTRCMVYCENGVLQDLVSPYRHNRFPFVPIWGFRRKSGNAPYGVIRGLIDPQTDLNKRRSKALFILSTNQVVADEDAVADWDEAAEEVARPDGIIRLVKRDARFEIQRNSDIVEEHVMLMQQDAEYIERTGGVTDEQMGRQTNAQSGKAILARQEQGHAVTAELFDNLRMSIQIAGEIMLSLVEQYYTERKTVRILGDRGQPEYTTINDMTADGLLNDITARQADFQVDSMNFSASARQAAFESMMNMIGQLGSPDMAMVLMDLALDLSDLPGKDEMVKRIRALTGQKDPDQIEETPEDMAAMQEQQAQAQQEAQLQAAMQQLEMAERQAKVTKMESEARAKDAGIALDQERVRIQKAEALHKIQTPPKAPPTDPNAQAQGNRPMINPYRYEEGGMV